MSTGRPHYYGHLLQVWKESLQSLTLYTSFHDLINVYSCRPGADNPRNFDINRNLLSLLLQKNLFEERGWQPLGDEILMSTGNLVTSVICCKFQKKSLWSLFSYNFFHAFTHLYSHRAGADIPRGQSFMSTEMSCHFTHLLQVSKKCFWSLILYNFFHDLIHVYNSRA